MKLGKLENVELASLTSEMSIRRIVFWINLKSFSL